MKKKINKLENELANLIKETINPLVVNPICETVVKDPVKIGLRYSQTMFILKFVDNLITHKEANLNNKEKAIILHGYYMRVMTSSLILLGSTDYISSLILMRSIFDGLVSLSTDNTGGMKEKLESIEFIDESEVDGLYKLWNNLCAWAHPYKKWEKNICPIFYAHHKIPHHKHFEGCMDMADSLIDFMLITISCLLQIELSELLNYKKGLDITGIDFLKIPMSRERMLTY